MQNLLVNIIEFNGRKACINSYSHDAVLYKSMKRQLDMWTARFPNAIVRNEEMTHDDTLALVATKVNPWEVGEASDK